MKPYFGIRGGWMTFWVTVACGTDMLLFGYDQGVFGGVVVTPDFLNTLNLNGPEHTSLLGTITALYDVGCFFGAVSAMVIGEMLGRKKTILVGTTIMSIGAILQISAFTVPHMIVGRIVAGIGNGINTATAPVWQSETSQMKWRGKLVVIELILNILGFSISNWMTFAFSWLIAHDYENEAFEILSVLEDKDPDHPMIITEHKEIVFAVQYEREHRVSWWDLLRGRTGAEAGTCTIRRLILGAGSQAMQQLSGINVTSYYLPTVLIKSVGLSNKLARLLAACNSVSYLLFSLIGIPNVENWGRRKMMIFASAGQAFCYLIITVLLRYNEKAGYAHTKEVASGSIAFFFLYYIFFGIGFQGVPWLYPVEINSLAMRTKGAAIGTATNWAFNFMVVEITPIGIQNLQWKFYIIWTVLNASFVPIVYLFYPETAGRTLEDLDRIFREHPPMLIYRDKVAISSKRPQHFIDHEEAEVRRNSSFDPRALRRGSKVRSSRSTEVPSYDHMDRAEKEV